MDKKSKDHIQHKRKRNRPASSSSSSSSDSDSSSYSSSSSADKKRHKKKTRKRSSSSEDEKIRRREKHACHRKMEAKKSHLKRKLKEAKAKKRAALSPRSAMERKHHHLVLKERLKEKEREKLRLVREREESMSTLHHRSPAKQKYKLASPSTSDLRHHHHHQLPVREKIIIQTRRERSPMERKLGGTKDVRYRLEERRGERERIESSRKSERDEELARCQRERSIRDKIIKRGKEFDENEQRLLPRPAEREMAIAAARSTRDKSPEPLEMKGHAHSRRDQVYGIYDKKFCDLEHHNDRNDEREYLISRQREISPNSEHPYLSERHIRSDFYPEEGRFQESSDRRYHHSNWEEHHGDDNYPEKLRDWKSNKNLEWDQREHWEESPPKLQNKLHPSQKWIQHPHKQATTKKITPHAIEEENWEDNEKYGQITKKIPPKDWKEQARKHDITRESLPGTHMEAGPRWHHIDWRGRAQVRSSLNPVVHLPLPHPRGFRPTSLHPERPDFRRAAHLPHLRQHHPFRHPRPPFPHQSKMVYTNPNLLQNKAAQLAKIAASRGALNESPNLTLKSTGPTLVNPTQKNDTSEGQLLKCDDGKESYAPSTTTLNSAEQEARDNLSEVSDENDEIKNKKLSQETSISTTTKDDPVTADEEDILDFEEISDGELEEECRKNLGDALGVDWAGLVVDSKTRQAQIEPITTAKQKWQPNNIVLDVGISFKYAEANFAKEMLAKAEESLTEINHKDVKIKMEKFDDDEGEEFKDPVKFKDEHSDKILPAIACIQVAMRKRKEEKRNLIFTACGQNNRALSARKDLKLRRQLCGLPETEQNLNGNVSSVMKDLAIKAFQRINTTEVR